MTEAQKLFHELNDLIPSDPKCDGSYETDGSYELLYEKFEEAFFDLFVFTERIIKNMRDKEVIDENTI